MPQLDTLGEMAQHYRSPQIVPESAKEIRSRIYQWWRTTVNPTVKVHPKMNESSTIDFSTWPQVP